MLLYLTAYWSVIAISLANTILLLWLGFMVLFNAERRSWGIWLIGGGLLTGGAFFVSHTVILVLNPTSLEGGMNFWWVLGLGAVITLPFAWYTALLWYAGFWEDRTSALRKRHRILYALNIPLTVALWGLLLFANPFPTYGQALRLDIVPTPSLFHIPLLILLYPFCVLLSISLSIDALLRPGPARRMMGDLARRRAQPWLIATSAIQLLVGVLVAAVMTSVIYYARQRDTIRVDTVIRIADADLVISGLITLAVLSLGQAVARYEVFTGKTLPQQRFMRHWRDAMLLAFGFGGVMSASLLFDAPPIYNILLMALVVTLFYALFSRSSYVERKRYIDHLRPFVSSQRLYDHMTSGNLPTAFDISTPFYALCDEVLGARSAYLLPVGAFAPLIGQSIAYPAQIKMPSPLDLVERFTTPQTMCVAVDPAQYSAAWAVPLWSERGLIGVLLLGDKRNGGLYTQEEIEIARASGERLIDTQASAEMSRRLMELQRQRLAQNQVVDRRTRRMLHDEILPRLHATMLTMPPGSEGVVEQLAEIHHQIADLLHELPAASAPEVAQLGLMPALRKALDGELASAFDGVTWNVDAEADTAAQNIPLLTAEVVYYAVREAMRNAAVYGRGDQPKRALHLCVEMLRRDGLVIIVEDDGVGLDRANEPSTAAALHGSGHGLALHSTMMAVIGGSLIVESSPDQFTRVRLMLP
ncbi:MAG: ATP-binding protein [Chloroflexota bacterium]